MLTICTVHQGIKLLKTNPAKAGEHLEKGFSLIHPIISKAASWTLMPLLFRLAPIFGHYHSAWGGRAPEVARLLVEYITQASEIQHGSNHPFTVIFEGLRTQFYRSEDKETGLGASVAFWTALRDLVERHMGIANMDYTAAHCWAEYALAKMHEPDPLKRLVRLEEAWTGHIRRLLSTPGLGEAGRLQADLWMASVAGSIIGQGRPDDAANWFRSAEMAPGNRVQPAARWVTNMRLMRAYRLAGRHEDALVAQGKAREAELVPPSEGDIDIFVIAIVCFFAL